MGIFYIIQQKKKRRLTFLFGMDYENISDEELILRLRDGESNITDFIMDKYKNLVHTNQIPSFFRSSIVLDRFVTLATGV